MAPEQKTNPAAATASADLYSVSVLFYELLMDVQPTGYWQPPSTGRSDVPLGIDLLIENGLSNRPASRPQTAAGYRKSLVDAINNKTKAGEDKSVEKNGKTDIETKTQELSPQTRKRIIWGIGIVLVLLIIDEMISDDPYADPSFYSALPVHGAISNMQSNRRPAGIENILFSNQSINVEA